MEPSALLNEHNSFLGLSENINGRQDGADSGYGYLKGAMPDVPDIPGDVEGALTRHTRHTWVFREGPYPAYPTYPGI